MEKRSIDIPRGIDSLFTTQEQRDDMKKEKIENIDISLIDNFVDHPFKVLENDDMRKLEESIYQNGVLEPIIVREKENRYEILSGHRRKYASELIGNKSIPCIIRNMSDDEAIIFMVDSNLHREFILPSEKAKAYKMKLDAVKHQGKDTLGPLGAKIRSDDLIGKESGDSGRQVQRYIRLNELIPDLLQMVDNAYLEESPTIALRPAVELSYLNKTEQEMVLDAIGYCDATPSHAQAIKLRKLSSENKLDELSVEDIMIQDKPNQIPKVKVSEDKIKEVIPKSIKINNMEEFVVKACEFYGNYLKNQNRER